MGFKSEGGLLTMKIGKTSPFKMRSKISTQWTYIGTFFHQPLPWHAEKQPSEPWNPSIWIEKKGLFVSA